MLSVYRGFMNDYPNDDWLLSRWVWILLWVVSVRYKKTTDLCILLEVVVKFVFKKLKLTVKFWR